jgi:hypothetical protein
VLGFTIFHFQETSNFKEADAWVKKGNFFEEVRGKFVNLLSRRGENPETQTPILANEYNSFGLEELG